MSAVRLIGLIAREYHTPLPEVRKLSWAFFLALLSDYNERMKAEEEASRRSASGMNRFGPKGSVGGF